jgi:hypothetical protein
VPATHEDHQPIEGDALVLDRLSVGKKHVEREVQIARCEVRLEGVPPERHGGELRAWSGLRQTKDQRRQEDRLRGRAQPDREGPLGRPGVESFDLVERHLQPTQGAAATRDPARGWLRFVEASGPEAVARVYLDTLEGRAAPDQGHVLSLLPP